MEIWEDKITIPFQPLHEKRYSLSAVPTAREYQIGSSGFLRDCDAYYEIRILDPHDCISEMKFHLNDMTIDVPKRDGVWEIENWFTTDRVLPVCILPYTPDYFSLSFRDGDFKKEKEVQITYKKVKYEDETIDRLMYLTSGTNLPITYPTFRLIFCNGLVGYMGRVEMPYSAIQEYKITSTGLEKINT